MALVDANEDGTFDVGAADTDGDGSFTDETAVALNETGGTSGSTSGGTSVASAGQEAIANL